jgi:hypothetical protein
MTRLALITILLAGAAGHASASLRSVDRSFSTVASSCPAKLPPTIVSARPGAQQELVPPGVRSLLLCSYHGLNPASTAGELVKARSVSAPAELDWLARTFDALRARTGLSGCPMDDGSAIVALFGYSTAPTDLVSVGLTGCRIVQNGHLTRSASLPPGPALIARLDSLLG